MARVGLYPGTFDPITNGHIDVIRRSLRLVDHLIVGIGINASKAPMLSFEERKALIEAEAAAITSATGGKVSVESFEGLLVQVAARLGASVIIRGLRGSVDYEYEAQMVGMNRVMNPEIETVFLAASPETQFVSSTLVRQIAGMGGDIGPFVPKAVAAKITARVAENKAR